MRLGRLIGLLLVAGLMSGCEVARAGLFAATVSHYHGETRAEEAPKSQTVPLPPRVTPK